MKRKESLISRHLGLVRLELACYVAGSTPLERRLVSLCKLPNCRAYANLELYTRRSHNILSLFYCCSCLAVLLCVNGSSP
jgi:hypothetical protein